MVLSDGEKMVFAAAFVQAGMDSKREGEDLARHCAASGVKAVMALRLLNDVSEESENIIKAMLGDNQ